MRFHHSGLVAASTETGAPLMTPEMYWIRDVEPLRLAILSRPRAGLFLDEEIAGWRAAGLTHVISLLEPPEVRLLGLLDEPAACRAQGIELISFPIRDRHVPASMSTAAALVSEAARHVLQGGAVGVHCRYGIGRSPMIAGAILGYLGVDSVSAVQMLSRARRRNVPNTYPQEVWLHRFVRQVGEPRNNKDGQ